MSCHRSKKCLLLGQLKSLWKSLMSQSSSFIMSHLELKIRLLLDQVKGLSQSKNHTPISEAMFNQSVLVRLPFELILKIVSFLPNASKKTLSFTCQGFFKYHNFLYFEFFFSKSDHFRFLCMLERDLMISKFACAGCEAAHMKSCFLSEELEKAPDK